MESASTSGPCGRNGLYRTSLSVSSSSTQYITVNWTLGGGHNTGTGPNICRFSASKSETSQNQFDQNILLDNIPCNQSVSQAVANVPIPDQSGIYYLQFHWMAGDNSNWYNCAILNVDVIVNSQTHSTQVTTEIDNIQNNGSLSIIYNAITLPPINDAYKSVLVQFNGTSTSGLSNLTVSANIPGSYVNGIYKTVGPQQQVISLCNLVEDTQQIYVSLFSSPDYVGNVTFTATVYEAELNFNDRQSIQISTQRGDIFYYRTAAYSTITSTRRMIVEGSGGRAYLSGPFNNCARDTLITTDPTYCLDLPLDDQETLRYYAVFFDEVYDGKVEVQKGRCSDYSGVSSLIVSILSLLALLLI